MEDPLEFVIKHYRISGKPYIFNDRNRLKYTLPTYMGFELDYVPSCALIQ